MSTFNFTVGGISTRSRQPDNETGLYLSKHKHQWVETGSHKWPSGDVLPVFRCQRCGDVICTEAVETR